MSEAQAIREEADGGAEGPYGSGPAGPRDRHAQAEADPVVARLRRSRAARRPVRPLRRGLTRLAIATMLTLPLVFALVAALSMIGREVTAPSWVKQRIEARAVEMLDGGRLRFGTIAVTVGGDLHPRVRLTDTVLRDRLGTVIARVPQVEATFSPRGLLLRQELLVQRVALTGAQVALRRAADGSVAVSFAPAGGNTLGRADNVAALLADIDGLFARPALAALERVTAQGLIVNYDDARAGRSWTVDDGQLALDLRGPVTGLRAEVALLSGRSYVTEISMDYRGPQGASAAAFDIAVRDAASADIASQFPALSWLSVLDAPLSATLRLGLDAEGAVDALDAALRIGAGALRPVAGAEPVPFERAEVAMTYDRAGGALRFGEIAVQSDWGALRGEGQAYLREVTGGWPAALEGQFTLTDIAANPRGAFPAPLEFARASAAVRLRLDPFTMTFGSLRLVDTGSATGVDRGAATGSAFTASGEVAARPEGWRVAFDAAVDTVDTARVLALWPEGFRSGTRRWFAENVSDGRIFNAHAALRLAPDSPPVVAAGFEYDGATVRVMRTMPPVRAAAGTVTLIRDDFTVALDAGRILSPQGGAVDVAGSAVKIPDVTIPQPPARITLRSDSTITAALALLDRPPFRFLERAGLPVTLADGRARAEGTIRLPLRAGNTPEAIRYDIGAVLRDVRTEVLVPGRALAAARLQVQVDPQGIEIAGPLRVGAVPADAVWRRAFGPDAAGGSTVEAEVELSERFIDEFAIGLPAGSVGGAGTGALRIDLDPGAAPRFSLTSDLRGLTLRLAALGWTKAAGSDGSLEVAGALGPVPSIDRIALSAPGLSAAGRLSLTEGGGLARARFDTVRLGDWFAGPVDLIGRGTGRVPGVEIGGGTLDLARATLGGGEGGGGGPMRVALDRLEVAQGLALTDLRGEFDGTGGFSGEFAARVNGGSPVQGTVTPQDGRLAVRLISDQAGGVLSAAGLIANARGGAMDLTLTPVVGPGYYDGDLRVTDLQVRDAPALASLLGAISVVGLLQQMGGQGLAFTEVEAAFRIAPDRITVTSASAVGPSLGISLDGIYTLAGRVMDFQGVVSPIYLLNGVGSLLTRKGEGLIGFSFTLRGPFDAVQVGVNPLSALAPGMFRELFRRPPPTVRQ